MPAAVTRLVYNILAKDLATSALFYERLAGFQPIGTSDFQVVLAAPGGGVEIALIDQVSEFVPRGARGVIQGTFMTLVLEDVVHAVNLAREMGVEVVEEAQTIGGGATRAVIRDPNGLIIDLATPGAELYLPPRDSVA